MIDRIIFTLLIASIGCMSIVGGIGYMIRSTAIADMGLTIGFAGMLAMFALIIWQVWHK